MEIFPKLSAILVCHIMIGDRIKSRIGVPLGRVGGVLCNCSFSVFCFLVRQSRTGQTQQHNLQMAATSRALVEIILDFFSYGHGVYYPYYENIIPLSAMFYWLITCILTCPMCLLFPKNFVCGENVTRFIIFRL